MDVPSVSPSGAERLPNFKNEILNELQSWALQEELMGEQFKVRAYTKVIDQIKKINKIQNWDDIKHVKGIGVSIRSKIDKIFNSFVLKDRPRNFSVSKQKKSPIVLLSTPSPSGTTKLSLMHSISKKNTVSRSPPKVEGSVAFRDSSSAFVGSRFAHGGNQDLINTLLQIHGIGPAKVKELIIKYKIQSVSDLQRLVDSVPKVLNRKQTIGLMYFNDIVKSIPRHEMDIHSEYLHSLLKHIKPPLLITIAGSYRRQEKESGDIDILICPRRPYELNENGSQTFNNIIEILQQAHYIKETLARGNSKYMGIVKLPGYHTHRRMDILFVHEPASYVFSLLYFTGNREFNIAFRKLVKIRGFELNEYSLYYHLITTPGAGGGSLGALARNSKTKVDQSLIDKCEQVIYKSSLHTPDETINKKLESIIFNKLELPYIPPKYRSFEAFFPPNHPQVEVFDEKKHNK